MGVRCRGVGRGTNDNELLPTIRTASERAGELKHVGAYVSKVRVAKRTSSKRHRNKIVAVSVPRSVVSHCDEGGRATNNKKAITARGRTANESGGRRTTIRRINSDGAPVHDGKTKNMRLCKTT